MKKLFSIFFALAMLLPLSVQAGQTSITQNFTWAGWYTTQIVGTSGTAKCIRYQFNTNTASTYPRGRFVFVYTASQEATYSGVDDQGNAYTTVVPPTGTYTIGESTSAWTAGSQISFLFGLTDTSGNLMEIRHNPVYSSESNYSGVSGTEYPLYAVRQLSSSDLSSIDLWSFRLKSKVSQRGGVTILNNVINVNGGESTVVQVDMSSSGNLNVIVMTLDGNVVKYLQHGKASEGTHYYYWNGKNNAGNSVARGLYFIRVVGEGIDETRKVMVVKE